MNRDLIKIVKKITKTLSINQINSARAKISEYCAQNEVESRYSLELFFICLHFKEDEEKANNLLINLIPNLQVKELVILFNKVTDYTDQFIQYCKKFSHVKQLRPVISEIFKKLKITYEEGDFYCFDNINEDDRISIIKRLFQFINTSEFKRKKEIIKPIIRKYSHLLPELNELGYRNFCLIKCIDIFLYDYSAIHKSETIRLQHFEQCDNFIEIFLFLKYNQMIINPLHQKKVIFDFSAKLEILKADSLFPAFIELVLHGIIKQMCRSSNLTRRLLGAGLLCQIIRYSNDSTISSLINALIYDVSSEIRCLVSEFNYLDSYPTDYHLQNLVSNDFSKICGASIYLIDIDSYFIFKRLISLFTSGNENIYGLMYLLNKQNFISQEYSNFVNSIHKKYIGQCTEFTWRILKECCVFYNNINNYDMLMSTLLYSDHMGLIYSISDIFQLPSHLKIDNYLEKGLDFIVQNTKNVRKSGGLSIYFLKLVDNECNYLSVKAKLFNLIGEFHNGLITLKEKAEHILFHTLNILVSLSDKDNDDLPFYLLLGFSCFNCPYFSAKNCGFALLSSVFKRIFFNQYTLDAFFSLNPNIRSNFLEIFMNSINQKNNISIYYCLFIYHKLLDLNPLERNAIEICKSLGEFIELKANDILHGNQEKLHEISDPELMNTMIISCSQSNCIIHEMANILIYLNTFKELNFKSIYKKYKIVDSSNEYAMYQIALLLKKKGILKRVINCIEDYYSKLYSGMINDYKDAENGYIPDLDIEYLIEILQGKLN